MTRTLFLLGISSAGLMLTMVRGGIVRRTASRRYPVAGRCADSRRRLRWSGYTAADFS